MTEFARLELDGRTYEFPVLVGTEGERAIDISTLRSTTGYITLDDGYVNTGSCQSAITFIDGEEGILRYRGIPIETLAERSSFVETAYLLIFGHLPTSTEREEFTEQLTRSSALHEAMMEHFDAFPTQSHPMAIMSAMINALSTHERPKIAPGDDVTLQLYAARLISKIRTIAAASYKSSIGDPIIYPRHDLKYVDNFLHMMFSVPYKLYEASPEVSHALNMFLVLHADHEQNCSTSTVRMVASGEANLYASCSAGVVALWGGKHGGANVEVVQMLQRIRREADPEAVPQRGQGPIEQPPADGLRPPGLPELRPARQDPARGRPVAELDEDRRPAARHGPGTGRRGAGRRLLHRAQVVPNVDFYSGIILRAIGIPLNMFTVMFAMGRMPGWIANWKELHDNPAQKIYRPRQLYVGNPKSEWVPRHER